MTLKEKMISEAFHGRLHRNRHRLSLPENISLEDYYQLNKRAVHAIFTELRQDLDMPFSEGMHIIILAGLKSFLDVKPPTKTIILRESDKRQGQPGWGYRVKKRRYH